MEIVSRPDIRSPEEAREYLVRLRQILRYIGVSEANMEDGNFRCDANVSLREWGATALGAKVEIKNMNSFRAVHDALVFEQGRQSAALAAGEVIPQETRGWVDERGVTVSQRSKEQAHDYRYFPEPDLPPLRLSSAYVEGIRATLPPLPAARKARLRELGLSQHEAEAITETRERVEFFDALFAALATPPDRAAKLAANWLLGDVARWQNLTGEEPERLPVTPAALAELITMAEAGTITGQVAHEVFERMIETGEAAATIVQAAGLATLGAAAADELTAIVRAVIAENEKAVADYHAGKETAVKFLIGQVMRQTRGRADPALAQDLLVRELKL